MGLFLELACARGWCGYGCTGKYKGGLWKNCLIIGGVVLVVVG